MNIYLHELRAYRKSTIAWTLSMVALIVVFLSIFPSFTKDAAEFQKLLQNYPQAVLKALGISLNTITSLLGFYSYIFMYVILCGSIQAMNLGTSVLSKELREKTADFLLTKPVTRTRTITAKLLAILTSLAITNVVYITAAVLTALAVKQDSLDMKIFLLISLSGFLVQIMFMALGVIVSVIVPKIKSVLPISLATVLSFFIVNMLGSIFGEKAVRYVTPFKYYDMSYILKNSSYEAPFVIIESIFVIAAIFISYVIYKKKDIHTV